MKVLYITSKPPYPIIDGGCFASAQFLRTLMKGGFDIRHFTISTEKHPFELEEYPEKVRKKIAPKSVFVKTKVKPVQAVKGLLTEGSYNVKRFYSEDAMQQIISLLESDTDLIILDSLFSSPYLSELRNRSNAKIYLRSHNVEHLIWEELAMHSKSIAKRPILKKLAKDLKKYELDILNDFDGILTITNEDKITFGKLGIKTPLITVPIPVELPKITPDYSVNNLFHIGSMYWEPNVEAVETLIEWIPDLLKEIPDLRLHLAGGGLNGSYRKQNPSVIVEDGFVEDVYEYAAQKGILVSPIISGSGVRVKILEMMALGTPIITTRKGALGISDLNTLLIADSKEEFHAAIIRLVRDEKLRETLGIKARNFIENNHSIDVISKHLKDAIGKQ